jgi:phenylacetate-coenzyme A ligase PaaK-like adenylate-forming protein
MMLVTALAQLRLAAALLTGRPIPTWALDRLVVAARDSLREFGHVAPEGQSALTGPSLDPETRRAMQISRFQTQAARAAAGTSHYARLFAALGCDPRRLTWDDIGRLPVTTKDALRDRPDTFVHRQARPVLCSTTSGTTGRPTQIVFSAQELATMTRFAALGQLLGDKIRPDDVVINAMSSRASLGNLSLSEACTRIGAVYRPLGLIEPARILMHLSAPVALPGHADRPTVLSTYASMLGVLVESGLAMGYSPPDFRIRRIAVGGEVVTEGLMHRARRVFGSDVVLDTGYAMTETYPLAGMPCEHGHLHFEPSHGLVEVLDPETGLASAPGAAGHLVITPFPPYRDTTLLLRYDTQDVVRAVEEPMTCNLRHLPATGNILGKRALAVRHQSGWTYPADIVTALDTVEAVPLPARWGMWAEPGGIGLDVVVRAVSPDSRQEIEAALAHLGVPVVTLRLLDDPAAVRSPVPLRCDLREMDFGRSAPAFPKAVPA